MPPRISGPVMELMREKPYQKITVREICDRSDTGRVTFYNHYDDKYDLLLDCFENLQQKTTTQFQAMQEQNNPDRELSRSFENLMNAIADTSEQYKGIPLTEDLDLMMIYYETVLNHLEEMEAMFGDQWKTPFDHRQLNSFLAMGFWGFLHGNASRTPAETRRDSHLLVKDLVESHIFSAKS